MASLLHSSANSFKSIVGFHRPTTDKGNNTIISFNDPLSPPHGHPFTQFTQFTLRLKKGAILPKQRIIGAFASNNKSSKGSQVTKRSDNNEANSTSPPLLTILAGLICLLLVTYIFGSIFLWLVNLMLFPPVGLK